MKKIQSELIWKIKRSHSKVIKAFTLVELIVVIAIITLISSSWIMYFLNFISIQKIEQKFSIIEYNMEQLDKKVKNYEIYDYELNFSTSSTWKLLYITYINNFDTKNQTIKMENITSSWAFGTWVIKNNLSWTWIIKIYKELKLFVIDTNTGSQDYKFNFNDKEYYKILSSFTWESLNQINLNYFSEDNLYPEKRDILELTYINTQKDKLWTVINKFKLTNIWWVKKFYKDNWSEITSNEIYLFFDNNGREKYIKITR